MKVQEPVLWFKSVQSWIIPVLNEDGEHCRASQIVKEGSSGRVFNVPESATQFLPDECPVGSWVVEAPDHRLKWVSAEDFVTSFKIDQLAMQHLADEIKMRANDQYVLSGYLDGQARSDGFAAAESLNKFHQACLYLSQREDFTFLNDPQHTGFFEKPVEYGKKITPKRMSASFDVNDGKDKAIQGAMRAMQSAFSGKSPISVWASHHVKLEIPAKVVGDVMRLIAEKGGDNGSSVTFPSLSLHRDVALDAILQSGSDLTMGVPLEDTITQKKLRNQGIAASSRMIDITREMLAPHEMAAIRHNSPGEVMPFEPVEHKEASFKNAHEADS